MKTLSFNQEVNVPMERISCALIDAFEGGSNYWYMITLFQAPKNFSNSDPEDKKFKHVSYPMNEGGYLIITTEKLEGEQTKEHKGKQFKLDLESLKRGLKLMAEKETRHFNDLISEEDDATTGDVFLQLCLFGEVIYG